MAIETNNIVMNKLPNDFQMNKYGIEVRLVDEKDTPFILSLRADKWLTRFIHQTDNDEQKQREWIRNYKEREKEGKEYYFIYSKNGIPFGLNRIYDIHDGSCTSGSWLCVPGTPVNHSISTALLNRDIMFGILGIKEDNFDVRKGNKKVQKFHLMTGSVQTGETELDILYRATPDTHEKGKRKILKLLNIEEYGNQ
ncbi:MAG: hypothetical protein K2L22_07490 [Muribaculaceae bacterium]|nr:hypothetical protein [Muribaculaceae bacterium]